MTATAAERNGGRTRKLTLTSVRRVDAHRLKTAGPPPGQLPGQHGGRHDPRYPSPATLRVVLAFLVDLVVHAGGGAALGFAAARVPSIDLTTGKAVLIGVAAFLVLSLVDRVVVQRIFQATVGKLITGLVIVRADNGERPSTGLLLKRWLAGVGELLSLLST